MYASYRLDIRDSFVFSMKEILKFDGTLIWKVSKHDLS